MAKQSISQQGDFFHVDVLVIGSGVAGLTYALELAKEQPQLRIALINKKSLQESNSTYAQGGIAAATVDAVHHHVSDTLLAGDAGCRLDVVESLLAAGPDAIAYLDAMGVAFDCRDDCKHGDKDFDLASEGGHSHRRIYHCGDQTGANIVNALIQQVRLKSQIMIFENHMAINLITQSVNQQTEMLGAYVLDELTKMIHVFLAKITVLATGGAGKVYRYTSNPFVATGDGIAMAYRIGARVANMEFYQFHPTLLYHLDNQHLLISEALRGEGAYLRLPTTGERFMKRYAPEAMELATRDIVARAIYQEMEKNNLDFVHLDIRHKDKEYLSQRFPMIYRTLLNLDIDMSKDLIPVVPAAHYLCGGVVTDAAGNTDIARLLALGETACTGLHGANRLASNSLLEGIVMGRMAAKNSVCWLEKPITLIHDILPWSSEGVHDPRRASQLHVHWRGLRGEMMAYAGLIRTEAGLHDQLELILLRKKMIETYYWHYVITTDLIELRNIVLIAELIVRSALLRCESRGGHFREDCPEKIEQYDETILQLTHY